VKGNIGPAEELFLALANIAPHERHAYLRAHCPDAAVRAEVEAMLASLDAPDEAFLDPSEIPAIDMAAVDGPLQPGTILGDFLVLHAIGSGAMGVVYAAQQDRPRRTVAIKVLRRGFRHIEIVKRFQREAEVLGRLQHPGIAQVFAFHPGDRRVPAHLVMELIEGLPVTDYADARGLSPSARIDLIVDVCDAIQHAHDRGIVHRDLKPANVLVSDGRPRILDFGVARATGLDVQSSLQTAHGQVLGTIAYMSPEQLRGATSEVDGRSDVYAVGVLLFRLLTGRLPYAVGDLPLFEAAQHILRNELPRLRSVLSEAGEALDRVIARAMAGDRHERYESAAALAADLRACQDGRGPSDVKVTAPAARWTSARPLIAISPDEQVVAVALASGVVVLLDARSGEVVARLESPENGEGN
jgi:eukaryotic-like serine/threonine-protein kinase